MCVNFEKFSTINSVCDQSQPSVLAGCDWSQAAFMYLGEFLIVNTQQTKFSEMSLFSTIITSVKLQLKLLSAKYFLILNFL